MNSHSVKQKNDGSTEAVELFANTEWKSVEVNGVRVDLPSDWRIENIGKSIPFTMGSTPTKTGDNYMGDIPWVTISNIKGPLTNSCTAKIKKPKSRVLPRGSLIGSFKMSVGRFSVLGMEAATNEAIVGVAPDQVPDFSLEYLRLALKKPFEDGATTNGQGVKLLNTGSIRALNFVAPPKEEQQLIARIICTQESQIADLRKQATLERQRLSWLSDELLSGRLRVERDTETADVVVEAGSYGAPAETLLGIRLVANTEWKSVELNGEIAQAPIDWVVEKIKKKSNVCSGGTPAKNDLFYDGGIPWITTTDLNNGVVRKTKRTISAAGITNSSAKIIPKNSVLLAMYGASIGKMGLSAMEATTNQSIAAIWSESHSNEYLFHALWRNKGNISLLGSGSGQPNISQSIVLEFELLFAPLPEQQLISHAIAAQQSQISSLDSLIMIEERRLSWLSDELLSGRLRVRQKTAKQDSFHGTQA